MYSACLLKERPIYLTKNSQTTPWISSNPPLVPISAQSLPLIYTHHQPQYPNYSLDFILTINPHDSNRRSPEVIHFNFILQFIFLTLVHSSH